MSGNHKAFLELEFPVAAMDFVRAGRVASQIKRALEQAGMPAGVVRRAAIAAYEAEMNIVIHSHGGVMRARIAPNLVEIEAQDWGPGIPDVELAMQEGYSTAPREILEMGFGAGMGLPNMRKCADRLDVRSEVGRGTQVVVSIYNAEPQEA